LSFQYFRYKYKAQQNKNINIKNTGGENMKVTFPHMGNMYIPVKVLLDTIGIDYVMPSLCNKKSLESGVANSPEFACLPFKTILGNFIEGIENGADLILFGGGCGQCRLGYYGDLLNEILKSMGYRVKFVYLELNKMSFKGIIEELKPVTEGKSLYAIIKGIMLALKTVFTADRLNRLANYTRCHEINKGQTDMIVREFELNVQKAVGYREINNAIKTAVRKLRKVKIDKKATPLKIVLIGEIYVLNEPFVNVEIEKKLGNMGVQVYNTLPVSKWIKEHLIKNILPFKIPDKPHEAGKEYMHTNDIGGHGLSTIGNAILHYKKKFDGAIQVYPLTCMPEIIAQCTFAELQKKYNIPIMTLVVDEMTGEAGYVTRLEAFVDMLRMKKAEAKRAKSKKMPPFALPDNSV